MFCALRRDGGTTCYEFDDRDWTRTGWALNHAPFVAVSMGSYGDLLCGVHADGSSTCLSPYRPAGAPAERYASPAGLSLETISVGTDTVCGLDGRGTIHCWGRNGPLTRLIPSGSFVGLDIGYRSACALRADGSVSCWGEDPPGSPEGPPLRSISILGDSWSACGVTRDGAAACWGIIDHSIYGSARSLFRQL
jgi:hypothetical protein